MIHGAPIDDITKFIVKYKYLDPHENDLRYVKEVDRFKYEFLENGKKEHYYIRNIDETPEYIRYLFDTKRYDMVGIPIASMKTKAQKQLYEMLSPKYKKDFPKFNDFFDYIDPLWAYTATQASPVIKSIVSDIGIDAFVEFLANYIDTKTFEKYSVANDIDTPKQKSLKNIRIADNFAPE